MPEIKRFAITDGIAYPNESELICDPAITISVNKDRKVPLWASTEVRPWRQLSAIFEFLRSQSATELSPLLLSAGIGKMLPGQTLHIWAGGLHVSVESGEQCIKQKDDYVESEFYFPVDELAGYSYAKFCNLMALIESKVKKLRKSIDGYLTELQVPEIQRKMMISAVITTFWQLAEKDAQKIIDVSFGENIAEVEQLEKKWDSLVLQLYSENCPFGTARQLMTWSENKPFSHTKTKKKG